MIERYHAYTEYKDSGVEWLGVVPEGWFTIKFGITNSSAVLGGNYSAGVEEEGLPLIKMGNLGRGLINLQKLEYLPTNEVYEENHLLSDGDFLFNTRNSMDLVGKVSIWRGELEKSLYNSNILKISFHEKYVGSTAFINYLFNSDLGLNLLRVITKGTTSVAAIYYKDLKSLVFAMPPIKEQQQIANFLDHETTKIDTLIEKQQQLIKLLKEKRQAVISHAVTKGLDPDAPMKDSGVEWLEEVPEHWEVCKLKHVISSLESGVSVNASDIPAESNENGVLKTSCVYTRYFRVEENKTAFREEEYRLKCPIRKGAIIISRMNTPELVGASALVEVDSPNIYLPDRLWQTVFANNCRHDPKYIAYFMMIKGFRNQISLAAEGASSSMQNIAKEDYLSINIALPDIREQTSIVSHLVSKLFSLQALEKKANRAIELMQERRTALISAAVTGKIDVRNWQLPEQNKVNKEDAL